MDLNPQAQDWVAFELAMRLARDDDTPRVVFADYLEDTCPEAGLHAFIRASVEVSRHFPEVALAGDGASFVAAHTPKKHGYRPCHLIPRALSLLKQSWLRLPVLTSLTVQQRAGWRFARGFPAVVVMPWDRWLTFGDQLCQMGPVGDVVLLQWPAYRVYRQEQTRTHRVVLGGRDMRLRVKCPEVVLAWDKDLHQHSDRFRGTIRASFAAVVEGWLKEAWPRVESIHVVPDQLSVPPA